VKEKRTAVKKRFFNYLVLADHKRHIFLNRREAKDIWQGLYEFKLIETEQEVTAEQLLSTEEVKELCANDFAVRYVSGSYTHVLTHQQLHSKFYVITKGSGFSSEQLSTSIAGLDKFAFPRLIEKFLTDCDLKEIL
jgi:A/G-specific adenine glycosylase